MVGFGEVVSAVVRRLVDREVTRGVVERALVVSNMTGTSVSKTPPV